MKTLEEVNYICPICGRDLAEDPEDWMEEMEACVECVAEGRCPLEKYNKIKNNL